MQPPGRPPGSNASLLTTISDLRLKHIVLWGILFAPACTAALQQQASHNLAPSHQAVDAGIDDRLSRAAPIHDSLYTPESEHIPGHRGYRDTFVDSTAHNNKKAARKSSIIKTNINERALATLSPAGDSNNKHDPAVRAPPPAPQRSPASSAGLASRQSARSLQDWQVEDLILLATVDGKIHARDRRTGSAKWVLEADRPMVETIYHKHNKSVDEDTGLEVEDPLWIVEPSQDGSIYVYAPGSGLGVQKLGYTVKQLAELAPYAGDGIPAVAYTAEKKNTLYTVDAGTGNILKMFSSGGSITNSERSCRRLNPLEEGFEEDECEPIGTLTLGRTEYIIGIQDRNTGEQISTLRYFEWGPNNRDQDLRSKYFNTMDNRYVYTKHDGTIFGLDMARGNDYRPVPANKPIYRHKFSSPVARVYDVVRPYDDASSDASLVVLPQPISPSLNDFAGLEEDGFESIFVNCTEAGSWYALSETNYPTVTEGASTAKCYAEGNDDIFRLPGSPMTKYYKDRFMGIHQLNLGEKNPGMPLIDAPIIPALSPPSYEDDEEIMEAVGRPIIPLHQQPTSASLKTFLFTMIFGFVACAALWQNRDKLKQSKVSLPMVPAIEVPQPASAPFELQGPGTPMVREAEPAQEIIFPHEEKDVPPKCSTVENKDDDDNVERDDEDDNAAEEKDTAGEGPKKPKHKRGRRGGKKEKEKQAQKGPVAQNNGTPGRGRNTSQVPLMEVISVAASESPTVTGALQINSLVINTDKVIGQGSCGTCVFSGTFENREVAVKRMLSQYYELASQEVSFLQQSDDHPNVVRYFCQQRDEHFLYIAVELCQASLFEVYDVDHASTAKDEDRVKQLRELKHSIQRDIPRTLHQLAAGLHHLHDLRIIHRDIKPQNILVAYPKKNQTTGPRLVISDFGLGKNLPENVSTLIDPTGNAGTSGWKAPELISQPKDAESRHSQQTSQHNTNSENTPASGGGSTGIKRAADIFSLGCLFFWVLTDGAHPFEDENGWTQLRELNIKRGRRDLAALARWDDAYEPMQLIGSMLSHHPEERPTAAQVLNHPFFWSTEKRLAFLCDCSDHFEREPRGTYDDDYAGDSDALWRLERRAEEIIGPGMDFLAVLDRHFVDTLGRQRKYSGNRLLDLLRALRNKKNHYEDMPEEVKRRVGPLPGGYLLFWSAKFPRLLMGCYEVVYECRLQGGDRFKGYFNNDSP